MNTSSKLLTLSRFGRPARYRCGIGSRRRGVVTLYVALGMTAFLGITALVVDMGNLYTKRAQAQRAADAAALAGALEMATALKAAATSGGVANLAPSTAIAKDYAKYNGYDPAKDSVEAYPVDASNQPDNSATPSRFMARVARNESLYFLPAFAALLGQSATTQRIGATAVAQVAIGNRKAPQSINGSGRYGMNEGPSNPAMFGPYAKRYNGDPYSPMNYSDGSPNDKYRPGGYDYTLNIPQSYIDANGSLVQLEIFDPNTNNGGSFGGWDEMWNSTGSQDLNGSEPTTTVYSLYSPPTSAFPNGQLIATASYGNEMTDANGNSINEVWVTPDGFKFDIGTTGPGNYRINVKTTTGAAENGFNLRAGPQRAATDPFNPDNGTGISADGALSMNFTKSGTSVMQLGYVPIDAAGGKLFINKFDTDIGSVSVNYYYIAPDGSQSANFPGILAGNDQFRLDTLDLPSNYPGGTWYASYIAGAQDTSLWELSYSGQIPGGNGPSSIRLVQ